MLNSALYEASAKKQWIVRDVLCRYSSAQTFPEYVVHFLPTQLKEVSPHKIENLLQMSLWLEMWQGRFLTRQMSPVLSVEYGKDEVVIKKSFIMHSQVGICIFAAKMCGQKKLIWYYYTPLLYAKQKLRQLMAAARREHVTEVTTETSQN